MNKIFNLLVVLLFISQGIFAQTFPETFNYQAVARNDDGSPIANEQIVVEVTIIEGTDCDDGGSCNTAWQELHYPTTNEFGLFSIDIGEGQNTFAGSESEFSNINWNDFSSGNYFLKLRVDFGSSNYGNGMIDMGVVEFQAVPYTFSSQKALDIERQNGKVPFDLTELQDVNLTGLSNSQVLSWNGTNWINVDASAGGATSLSDLTDVTLGGLTTDEILFFNGTNWANTLLSVNQLSDVSITAATTGNLMRFNGTNWANATISSADLSDFNISSPTNGQAIIWNGFNWINQDVAGGSSVWTEDGSYVFYNDTKNVGIGTASPSEAFHVLTTADEGFLVVGTFASAGVVSDYGAGTRMTFFPSKSAFRVGTVDGTQWNDASTGDYSAAFGYNTIASANYSFVTGINNTASGAYSIANGANNIASGVASLVIGTNNESIGQGSLVFGKNNNVGTGTFQNNYSIVGGDGNDGYSEKSLTIGTNNDNYSNNSIVYGEDCRTGGNATGGMAGGNSTIANGMYSAAFGLGTNAYSYASFVLGRYNTTGGSQLSWVSADPLFVIGNGTSGAGNENDALKLTKDGNLYIDATLFENSKNYSKSNTINNYSDILFINGYYADNKYGFLSSEVEEYFPNLVEDFNNGSAINYTGFVPLIIETVKYQQQTIIQLQEENEILKNQLNDFEDRLQKLENE